MSDTLAARIRTVWVLFVGHIVAIVAVWLLATLHLDPSLSGTVELILAEALGLGASWLIWEIGHRLEKSENPTLAAAGRWLVSAGKQIGPPAYPGQTPPRADAVE